MKINIVNCFTTIIAVVVHIQFCYSSYSCPKSTPTISYVKSCPKNKSEWDSAANRKQCSSIADDLKCATPTSNFKYHCLLNRWRNATLEVCTSMFHLQGYCAVYDTQLHRVAENYEPDFECLNFHGDERCPPRYPSTDAYKYQKCYTKAIFTTTTTTATEATATKATANRESRPDGNDGVKIAFLVILSVVVIVLLSFILWKHGSTIYKKDGPETPLIKQPNSIQNTSESVEICMSGATCEPSARNIISSREDENEPLLQSTDEVSSLVPIEKNTTSVQTYESQSPVVSPSDKAALSQSSNIQSSNISDENAHATITCDTDTSDGKPLSKQRGNALKTSTSDDVSTLSPKPTPDTAEEEAPTFKSVDNKTTRENDEVPDSRSNDKLNPNLNNSSKETSTLQSVDNKTTRENDVVLDSKSNDKLNTYLNNSSKETSTLQSVDNKTTRENDVVLDSKSNDKLNQYLNNSEEKAPTFQSVDNETTRENDVVPDSKSNDKLNSYLNNPEEKASTFPSVDNKTTRENDVVPDSKSNDELNPFLNDPEEKAPTFQSVDNKTTRENDVVPDSKSSDELNPFLNDSQSDLLSTSDSLPPKTSNEGANLKKAPSDSTNKEMKTNDDGALANAKELPLNVVTGKESALGKNKKAPPRPTPPSLDNRSKESRREPSMKKQAPRPPPKQ